jgi:saccharopine dehydrogenase-like NADP-dependent oxidoreductase
VAVGGRNIENFRACRQRHNLASNVEFVPIDIFNDEELSRIIPSYDIIVHTAGPFQGLKTPALLEKTLALGKKYIDVCDDVPLSGICRSDVYQALAKKGKGSAVISTGIWPGGSSLLAQEVIQCAGGPQNIRNLTFSFFTAGSGGAGKTILTATFLILGENVITYVDNNLVYKKSATDKRVVDFGSRIGPRDVARLSLIECESCHLSGVKSVETYFGTAPPFWNSLFVAMTRIIPQSILQNRELMDVFAAASLPMVRLVDSLVGSTNGDRTTVCFLCFAPYNSHVLHH